MLSEFSASQLKELWQIAKLDGHVVIQLDHERLPQHYSLRDIEYENELRWESLNRIRKERPIHNKLSLLLEFAEKNPELRPFIAIERLEEAIKRLASSIDADNEILAPFNEEH